MSIERSTRHSGGNKKGARKTKNKTLRKETTTEAILITRETKGDITLLLADRYRREGADPPVLTLSVSTLTASFVLFGEIPGG